MLYLGEDEMTHMMGLGYPGEVRTGPDGNLYQWVEGYDGLGNPMGFWRKLRRLARRALKYYPPAWALRAARPFLRRALPFAQRVASFIPIPQAQAVAAGLRTAAPALRQAGVTGYNGLGALYQAPDGSLFQAQGMGEDEELRGFAEDEELRGYDGLGALYQAPDGTLYQVQGLSEDEELRGFAEDEELRGFAEDEELRGFAEDEELRGFAEDELGYFGEDELQGSDEADELGYLAEDEDLRGLAADDEMGYLAEDDLQGYGEEENLGDDVEGYVLDHQMRGIEAYVPDTPASTRMFVRPAQPPEIWKPLW